MTTLPNMNIVLPVRGAPGAGAWGDTLDADLTLVDAHDHSSGKGPRVTPAGININADLPFSALYAPTQLHRVQFSAIAGGTLTNPQNLSLFVSDGTGGLTANELYFRTSAGNHVKFTAGSTLNVGAFVGGIGGDYTSVSALLDFNDANKEYRHRQGGGTAWARVTGGGLRLLEFGTTETVFVGQEAPAALASSYTVTWPLALPAGKTIMQIDNAGLLSSALVAPSSKSFIAMDSSGVLSTTATSETFSHNMNLGVLSGGGASKVVGNLGTNSASRIALVTDTGVQVLPLVIPIGTLTGWSVTLNKASASGTISAKLVEGAAAAGTGTATQLGSTQSNNANNPGNISLAQTGLTTALTAGREYWIEVTGGGTTGDIITGYSATVAVLPT